MEQQEEGKKLEAPVLFRLFGVEVRGGDVDEEATEEEDGFMDLKKSSSMPNLTSIDPLLQAGEPGKGKGYASEDAELASRQQNNRRRKAHERKKGTRRAFGCRTDVAPWQDDTRRLAGTAALPPNSKSNISALSLSLSLCNYYSYKTKVTKLTVTKKGKEKEEENYKHYIKRSSEQFLREVGMDSFT